MALPLWQLKQLQMNTKHKIALALLFLLGFVVIAFDITRISLSVGGGNQSLGALWHVIETSVAVIVAALPTYRAFFVTSKPLSSSRYRNYDSRSTSGNKYPPKKEQDTLDEHDSDLELGKGKEMTLNSSVGSRSQQMSQETSPTVHYVPAAVAGQNSATIWSPMGDEKVAESRPGDMSIWRTVELSREDRKLEDMQSVDIEKPGEIYPPI